MLRTEEMVYHKMYSPAHVTSITGVIRPHVAVMHPGNVTQLTEATERANKNMAVGLRNMVDTSEPI